jgi:uncharacterized protein (DUF362 family)
MTKKLSRREFISSGSTAMIGSGLVLKQGQARYRRPERDSRVVEVTHPNVVGEGRKVDQEAVKKMLRRGLETLTGGSRPWAKFFEPTDRVGLKINCLGRPLLFTHHELVNVLVEELTDFGIPENNLIVWDRWEHHMTACRFVINTSDKGVRCYGSENPRNEETNRIDPDVVFESTFDYAEERQGGTASHLSSVFTKECDKVINLAILKDHASSGVTLCLKNLAYGLSDNNNRFHRPAHISRFIADFNAMKPVRDKVVLHIIDGLEGCFDHGPVPNGPQVLFTPRTLWLGSDPVALDAVGFRVIDQERISRGLPPLAESPSYYEGNRPVDHIDLAAKNGVGVADLGRIALDRVRL